jgi:hypothetical protein
VTRAPTPDHLAWKLRRDPYLGPLVARLGEDAAYDAGFFLDEDDEDASLDDVDWRCTPPPRLRASACERPVVLLSTGAFCPVHPGHIAMMERAKVAAEAAGFTVLGGYLSPGHDAYIESKCGEAAIPASLRLLACARAAAETSWLSVDPWEALHRRVAVNYTDVTARLRAYLRAHVDSRVDVLYVCGGDNARFGLAFVDDGGCVVVARPGADAELAAWRGRLAGRQRILWCEGDHPGASRALRSSPWSGEARRRFVVRLEDARAVRTLGLAPSRFEELQRELVALLAESASVRTTSLAASSPEGDVISMDAMLPSARNLASSRLFALGGYQGLGYVARPGAPPLEEQLAAIAPGDYVLHDDDRMTGGTLAAARSLLSPSVRITATHLAVEHDDDEDVVDSRDFLLGSDDGGLVVELPDGGHARAPYVLPYADPAVRASIPCREVHAFSQRVWSLNERAFRGSGLSVRDLPAPMRALFRGLGDDRPLEELCRFHLERLGRTARPRT